MLVPSHTSSKFDAYDINYEIVWDKLKGLRMAIEA